MKLLFLDHSYKSKRGIPFEFRCTFKYTNRYCYNFKRNSLVYPNISFEMQTMVNSLNKLLPVGKKVKKYLPFFIGFKLLTFTGFLTYMMNR